MRKTTAFLLTMAMVISLSACSSDNNGGDIVTTTPSRNNTQADTVGEITPPIEEEPNDPILNLPLKIINNTIITGSSVIASPTYYIDNNGDVFRVERTGAVSDVIISDVR